MGLIKNIFTEEVTENDNLTKKNRNGEILSGLVVFIPHNYVLVCENTIYKGKLTVKEAGLRVCAPWQKKTIWSKSNMPVDYKKEKYKSRDGYEVIIDTAVTYRIFDVKKFYAEEQALEQLHLIMASIMRRLVSQYNYDELASLKIDLDDYKFRWISDELSEFKEKYGLMVGPITIQKAELTDDLKKSKEEDELTRAKNRRNIEITQAEKEMAELKAAATRIEGEAKADVEAEKIGKIVAQLAAYNIPQKQIETILKEFLRRAEKVSIFEGVGYGSIHPTALGVAAVAQGIESFTNDNVGNNNGEIKIPVDKTLTFEDSTLADNENEEEDDYSENSLFEHLRAYTPMVVEPECSETFHASSDNTEEEIVTADNQNSTIQQPKRVKVKVKRIKR